MIFNKKKGIALNQAFAAVLMLVLVAVLVIVAIFLFSTLQDGAFTGTEAASVIGENITPIATVNNATRCGFENFVITAATNSTGSILTSGNWTTTGAGVVTNTTALTGEAAAPWNINYTYDWGGEACEATQSMIVQFATYPALIGLVGTIIFLGIVIGVLVASFVFGKGQGV